MLADFNHLTLAVTDLERSLAFYTDRLGFRLRARWNTGAYLVLGNLWLCLSVDSSDGAQTRRRDYTHYAFTIGAADFAAFAAGLRRAAVPEWRDNTSEGASIYFLDPDGHQLEAHVGDLATRLAECRVRPYAGMVFFD